MKILQICNKPPYPPVDGGAIAMNNTTLGLLNLGVEVKVLSISTHKHPVVYTKIPKDYLEKTKFEHVYIDTKIKIQDAFFNLFSNKSYNIERFNCPVFEKKIEQILKNESFDVIILESLFITPYIKCIRNNSKSKIVLRAHNIEHQIWERYSANTINPLKKQYLNLLAKRIKQYEIKILNQLDGIAAITKLDETHFKLLGFKNKIQTIPVGYLTNHSFFENDTTDVQKEVEENSLFHIASMDWLPNQEGLDWFIKEVWEPLSKKLPSTKFYIAGRNMPKYFLKINKKNLINVGEVESAKDFYQSKNIMVVPIKSGSGMRIKIIEGMAMGKTIISTEIGAEGIHCTHNQNILIANTSNEFIQEISKCLSNPDFCRKIGENAKKLIENEYSNDTISKNFLAFLYNVSSFVK
jgi:glycosyltransferase involved in cell wall biosynthesis